MTGTRDLQTFQRVYVADPRARRSRSLFFAEGFEYKLLGLFPTNIHLIGVAATGHGRGTRSSCSAPTCRGVTSGRA